MTKKCFRAYMRAVFQAASVPIRLYEEEELTETFEFVPFPVDLAPGFNAQLTTALKSLQGDCNLFLSSDTLLYGVLRDKKNGLTALIGPARSIHLNESFYKRIEEAAHLKKDDLKGYVDSLPLIPIGKFAALVASASMAVNGEVVDIEELYARVMPWKANSAVAQSVLKHEEAITYEEGEYISHESFDIEQQLLYYVRHGMVSELKERWRNIFPENHVRITEENTLRAAQDHALMGVSLVSNAATQAGLPRETAIKIREIYRRRIDQCTSIRQVNQIRYDILRDYAERTQNIRFHLPDSPFLERAVNYVLENIAQPLSLSVVADQLKTSKTYFSTKFKEEMGMPFTDFVNMQKIEKAKELLLFTDKSLLEISSYLSFSTQGYFQILFKKFTGTTPGAFRKRKAEELEEETP